MLRGMHSTPTPPPLPASPLEYYQQPIDSALDARTLVRRVGVLCVVLGGIWMLTNAVSVVESFLDSPNRGTAQTYRMLLTAHAVVSFALAVPLVIGGAMSLRAQPGGAARLLLVVFAVGTLSIGMILRFAWQGSIPGFFNRPSNAVLIIGYLASQAAVPLLLLIVLNIPGVRALYR